MGEPDDTPARPYRALGTHTQDEGALRTVIGRTYDLSQAAEAVAHVAEGHPCGKVLVTV